MMEAEKDLPKPDQGKYTPEWTEMLSMGRYPKLLKKKLMER